MPTQLKDMCKGRMTEMTSQYDWLFLLFISLKNLIINVFGVHIGFVILQVPTLMEVALLGLQIGLTDSGHALIHFLAMVL